VTPPADRRLLLLRHAKSSWDDPRLADHDRPLAARGERAVRGLREHLTGLTVGLDLVLCSSARRTTMTLAGITPALPVGVDTRVEEALYGASATQLLARLRRVPDELGDVMVIGHNPGLEDLALLLVGSGDEVTRERMTEKFPTGALATLGVPGTWAGLSPAAATLVSFVVPRDL
jgi:phosphohistidine phosphatase